jgi:hypothetical protein
LEARRPAETPDVEVTTRKPETGRSRVPSPPGDDGRRKAIVKTTLIVVVVLGLAFLFALTLTRRLISTWNP